jgi:hypothetical protein
LSLVLLLTAIKRVCGPNRFEEAQNTVIAEETESNITENEHKFTVREAFYGRSSGHAGKIFP